MSAGDLCGCLVGQPRPWAATGSGEECLQCSRCMFTAVQSMSRAARSVWDGATLGVVHGACLITHLRFATAMDGRRPTEGACLKGLKPGVSMQVSPESNSKFVMHASVCSRMAVAYCGGVLGCQSKVEGACKAVQFEALLNVVFGMLSAGAAWRCSRADTGLHSSCHLCVAGATCV